EPAYRAKRAGLSCPVRADQRRDLAGVGREGDPVHGLDHPVPHTKVRDFEERRQATSAPRYASRTKGSACTSLGVPSAILRPKFRTATRSHVPITSRTSCSMSRTAM